MKAKRQQQTRRINKRTVKMSSELMGQTSDRYSVLIHSVDLCLCFTDNQYDEDDDEITPDLWQEACWIVIR